MIAPQGGNRRRFLASLALLAAPRAAFGDEDGDEIEAVKELGRKAGLKVLGSGRNEQYLAIGDAPNGFRTRALELCLALSKDYLKIFAAKGLPATRPAGRLTVVVLSSPEAFAAFTGENVGETVGGHYDLETNRLVMFDNRQNTGIAKAELANTIALMHEATHQLNFNTGLLDRQADVPLALSEGLAMYGETRRPNGKGKVGDVNAEWLPVLRAKLIPVEQLLLDDKLLNDEEKANLARAESWLLVHHLLKTPALTKNFRGYLETIRARRDDKSRLADWTAAFGPPAMMDRELVTAWKKLS